MYLAEALTPASHPFWLDPMALCLVTKARSPLEPDGIENRYYALGVGLILTVDLAANAREELIDIEGP
jgi:hypothetical protein